MTLFLIVAIGVREDLPLSSLLSNQYRILRTCFYEFKTCKFTSLIYIFYSKNVLAKYGMINT